MLKKRIMYIVSSVIFFILLIYLLVNGLVIYQYGDTDEKQKCDIAIILGAATDIHGVSPVYEERINHGIWLYQNHYVDYMILTGGKARGAEFSDAYQAKQYAISKGIPENIIFYGRRIQNYSGELGILKRYDGKEWMEHMYHSKRPIAYETCYAYRTGLWYECFFISDTNDQIPHMENKISIFVA